MKTTLQDYSAVEDLGLGADSVFGVHFVVADRLMGGSANVRNSGLISLAFADITTVRVRHRAFHCYGIVLSSTEGWKIVCVELIGYFEANARLCSPTAILETPCPATTSLLPVRAPLF